jgi:mannose-6-phosphate isomerase-like protein (cupin superfamily)
LQEVEVRESKPLAVSTVNARPFVVDTAAVPQRALEGGALAERAVIGAHTGSPWLEQSVLECSPGGSGWRAAGAAEEVLFGLAGHGALRLRDRTHSLEPEAGAYLPPGSEYELTAGDDELLRLVSVRIPNPVDAAPSAQNAEVMRRLADLQAEEATTDREFRIIADPSSGLKSATQFVGYIPTARAPDHFHTYDEVIYVLDGEGVFHAGGHSRPLAPGSCIALPARTVHCLENTGRDVMRVVAVFRPAGSPAAAYYPDGSAAYGEMPPATSRGVTNTNEESVTHEEVDG